MKVFIVTKTNCNEKEVSNICSKEEYALIYIDAFRKDCIKMMAETNKYFKINSDEPSNFECETSSHEVYSASYEAKDVE